MTHDSWPTRQGPLHTRFDWYEMTVDGRDDTQTAIAIADEVGGKLTRGKGRNGYASCIVVERDDDVLAQVYGRSVRDGEVHVVTSSDACDEVVPIIRRRWLDHRVSRVDSAADFAADFADIDDRALRFAADRGLSHRLVTDSAGGATRYLGAPSSAFRVRVYKKSEQLRALHPDRAHLVPDGIVRVELQARPEKREGKEKAAQYSADDVWAMSKWAGEFARTILGTDPRGKTLQFHRPSSWARSLHYLGAQYAPSVARRIEDTGDPNAVVLEVLNALLGGTDAPETPTTVNALDRAALVAEALEHVARSKQA